MTRTRQTNRQALDSARQKRLAALVRQQRLGTTTARIALHLLHRLDAAPCRPVNGAALARELALYPESVHRILKRLVRSGLLLEGTKIGWHCSYRFDPSVLRNAGVTTHATTPQPPLSHPAHERVSEPSVQRLLAALARQPNPGLTTTRVALHLLPRLDGATAHPVNCAALAAELGMSSDRTRKAVKRLLRFGILLVGPKKNRGVRSFRLASLIANDTTTTGDPTPHTHLGRDTP